MASGPRNKITNKHMCQCQLKVSILKALRRRPNIPLRSVGSLNSSDSRVPISLLVSIHRQDLLT